MIQILRIQNPNALLLPDLEDLITRAWEGHSFNTAESILPTLPGLLQDPQTALFVVRDGGKYRGLVLMRNDPITKTSSVQHFYCQKAPKAREILIQTLVGFALEGGCDRLLTIDANRKPRAFRQLFKSAGESKEVGRVFEFDLTTSKYGGEGHVGTG